MFYITLTNDNTDYSFTVFNGLRDDRKDGPDYFNTQGEAQNHFDQIDVDYLKDQGFTYPEGTKVFLCKWDNDAEEVLITKEI